MDRYKSHPPLSEEEKKKASLLTERFSTCFSIPKIETHAHIGGCLRPATFMELAEKKQVNIEHLDFYKVDMKMAF